MSQHAAAPDPKRPEFEARQFAIEGGPECDLIMKGGITSGVVYPYAVLQIATKFRLRSIGGTSAGAIAAAFAAAAEYGRREQTGGGFLALKTRCDELPGRLLSLFQPELALKPAVDSVKAAVAAGGLKPILRRCAARAAGFGAFGGATAGLLSYFAIPSLYATALAVLLGALLTGAAGAWLWLRRVFVDPVVDAVRQLPDRNFGFCTGLTPEGSKTPAVTEWIYQALQEIAFGPGGRDKPLTFGDLRGCDGNTAPIELKVVTTNLSMRRPHTLPKFGVPVWFDAREWRKLFPDEVIQHLTGNAERKHDDDGHIWSLMQDDDLPVIVAVRMSLSFPLLFAAVPLLMKDTEAPSIIAGLGGTKPQPEMRKVLFSDGGLSSNFPVHLFDAPLPTRPTFAVKLDELPCDAGKVERRVFLPSTASEGRGVQIDEINTIPDFAWQVLNSAKDWQDQLLSELTGQRERIARVFLADAEGGLNIDMKPEVSSRLMDWGYEVGQKFTSSEFDFEEHKWRRLLVLYKHISENLEAIGKIWPVDFESWAASYSPKSYKELIAADRVKMIEHIKALLATRLTGNEAIASIERKLPGTAGSLRIGPKY